MLLKMCIVVHISSLTWGCNNFLLRSSLIFVIFQRLFARFEVGFMNEIGRNHHFSATLKLRTYKSKSSNANRQTRDREGKRLQDYNYKIGINIFKFNIYRS